MGLRTHSGHLDAHSYEEGVGMMVLTACVAVDIFLSALKQTERQTVNQGGLLLTLERLGLGGIDK